MGVFNSNYYQGTFVPKQRDKCINFTESGYKTPFYRSSWELEFMKFCDSHISVIKWGSEVQAVEYYSDQDNKMHTYFPDFYLKVRDNDKNIVEYMIEVKPKSQTPILDECGQVIYPKLPNTKSPKSLEKWKSQTEVLHRNNEKWQAARHYCNSHNIIFKVLTEKDIL